MNKLKKFICMIVCVLLMGTMVTPIKANNEEIIDETEVTYEVSEPMTLDELILDYSITNDISIETARSDMLASIDLLSSVDFGTLDPNYTLEYITISSQFTVTSGYKPSIKFYCYVSKSNYFGQILQILNVSLDRSYEINNTIVSKIYSGNVFVHLENDNTIYYSLDGDWYNTGTATYSGGTNIKVHETVTLNFSASNTTNFYYTDFIEGRVKWGERISL